MTGKPAEALTIIDGHSNEKMKEVIANRIQKRDLSRVLKVQQEQSTRNEAKVTQEKSSFFIKHFQEEVDILNKMLLCQGVSKSNRSSVLDHFDAMTTSFQRLLKFFSDSVMFLPSYNAQKAREQLGELREAIDAKRAEMLPKKKFAFKSKSKVPSKVERHDVEDNIKQLKETATQRYASAVAQFKDDCSVMHKTDETIILSNSEICKKDVTLAHLCNCKVYIYGSPGTVHISDVSSCVIVIGPVSGSVFVERCTKSTIATGCQQLRVHHTTNTDFYLHVTSRAIIEDTSEVRFAPYTILYPDINQHYASSGLDQAVNNWSSVDDFNWLAVDTQSPNWQLIEKDDRRQEW